MSKIASTVPQFGLCTLDEKFWLILPDPFGRDSDSKDTEDICADTVTWKQTYVRIVKRTENLFDLLLSLLRTKRACRFGSRR